MQSHLRAVFCDRVKGGILPPGQGTHHGSACCVPFALSLSSRETVGGPWCVKRGGCGSWWEPQASALAVPRRTSPESTPVSPPSWTGFTSRWRWVQRRPCPGISCWYPSVSPPLASLPWDPSPAVRSQEVTNQLSICQAVTSCFWALDWAGLIPQTRPWRGGHGGWAHMGRVLLGHEGNVLPPTGERKRGSRGRALGDGNQPGGHVWVWRQVGDGESPIRRGLGGSVLWGGLPVGGRGWCWRREMGQ